MNGGELMHLAISNERADIVKYLLGAGVTLG